MYNLQEVNCVLFAARNLMTLFNKFWAPCCEHHTKYIHKSLGEMKEFLNVTVAYNKIAPYFKGQKVQIITKIRQLVLGDSHVLCSVPDGGYVNFP